jgi:hypothetical protein
LGSLRFDDIAGVVKTIPLALMAVASLTIAAITVKAQKVSSPMLGYDEKVGGTTFHYGAPQITPAPPGTGKWIPFPVVKVTQEEAVIALVVPTVSLENGVVVGAGKPTFNHDGQAYVGYIRSESYEVEEGSVSDYQSQRDPVASRIEYDKNIKSGKWHKFVNGE